MITNNLKLPDARILVHVHDENDLDEILQIILKGYPMSTVTEIRQNTREPFEGGVHCLVYITFNNGGDVE